MGEGPGLRNRYTASRSSRCIPVLAWDASKQLNIGFGTVWKTVQLIWCFFHASIGMHSEELFDPVDLFLSPASILPVGCSGFREPAFLNRSTSRQNAGCERRMGIIKLFSDAPRTPWAGLTSLHFKTVNFPSPIERAGGPEVPSGLLGKSLIMSEQFDCVAKYCLEVKCPTPTSLVRTCWPENIKCVCTCVVLFCIIHLRSACTINAQQSFALHFVAERKTLT